MRSVTAVSNPCPLRLFGIPKIPNRNTSSIPTISSDFQRRFLFIRKLVHARTRVRCVVELLGLNFILRRGHLDYRSLGDFHAQIVRGNAEVNRIIFHGNDGAPQAATGNYPVTGFECVQHALPLFLAALLGKNQKEIKNGENENQGGNTEPSHTTASLHRQQRFYAHYEVWADESAKNRPRRLRSRKLLSHHGV